VSRKAWILFLSLGVLWGIPYLLIRIAVIDYHPVIVAFGRSAIGVIVLLPFALGQKKLVSGFQRPGWLLAYTIAEISAPWFLIGFAETRITSSLAALIIALTPILAAGMGIIGSREQFSAKRLLGLCLGLSGVFALLGFDSQPVQILPVVALGTSAFGYAIGPIIVSKKLSEADATGVVVASLIVASVFYLPVVPSHWPKTISPSATLMVVALAIFSTALAFKLLFALVAEVGAARATVVAYINPAFAVFLGIVVLNEPLSPGLLIGFVMILAGTYFATLDHSQSIKAANKSDAESIKIGQGSSQADHRQ
jgi:drug/metabolite transporter (DMT)-like permease